MTPLSLSLLFRAFILHGKPSTPAPPPRKGMHLKIYVVPKASVVKRKAITCYVKIILMKIESISGRSSSFLGSCLYMMLQIYPLFRIFFGGLKKSD